MRTTIKVLIVDDSALVRQALREVLATDSKIEVIGAADDPYNAVKRMREVAPDVLILDIEMPRMDGLTFLKKVMKQHPIPTVICSSLVDTGSATALAALESGAVDIIQKPSVSTRQFFEESRIRICDAVHAAASSKPGAARAAAPATATPKLNADVIIPKPSSKAMLRTTDKVVAIGASTGGTEALRVVMENLSVDCPGIVVVQHMPEHFTKQFADRLNSICRVEVKEATDGSPVLSGQVLIAPGNRHLLLRRSGSRYYVEVRNGPLVCRHRPSVDVLFRSAAEYAGRNAMGVIMTGMGDDGAQGLLEMRQTGARTIAQDEQSCVVFGMPNEAIKRGAAERVLPLHAIAAAVSRSDW